MADCLSSSSAARGGAEPHDLSTLLNEDQQQSVELWESGANLFLTGAGGTGKSRVLMTIIRKAKEQGRKVAVTSLTGAASFLIQGQTLHSWSGIRLGQGTVDQLVTQIRKAQEGKCWTRWQITDCLIIDEISMMDLELFEKLEAVARKIRGEIEPSRRQQFWGGLQLILAGDFAQLPPISVGKGGQFCFESPLWSTYLSPNTVYLTKNVRQNDPQFQQILTELRMGEVTLRTRQLLDAKVVAKPGETKLPPHLRNPVNANPSGAQLPSPTIEPTMLYPLRKEVEEINLTRYAALIAAGAEHYDYWPEYNFQMQSGIRKDAAARLRQTMISLFGNTFPAKGQPSHLEYPPLTHNPFNYKCQLCTGAQVMLTFNLDVEGGLTNGSRGVILGFREGDATSPTVKRPIIKFDTGVTITMGMQQAVTEAEDHFLIVRQFPLCLAWATTIHKVQGATISNVIADLTGCFSPGQVYVCLSRVRSLEGLPLYGWNWRSVKCHPKVKDFYHNLLMRPPQVPKGTCVTESLGDSAAPPHLKAHGVVGALLTQDPISVPMPLAPAPAPAPLPVSLSAPTTMVPQRVFRTPRLASILHNTVEELEEEAPPVAAIFAD